MRRIGVTLARIAAVCAAYVALGKAGLHFATIADTVSLVWPPTGLAIAALVLWGRPMALAVALGALLVNMDGPGTLPRAAGIAMGNTLEALLGAWLMTRFAVDREFRRRQDVLGLGATAALAPVAAAAVGPATLALVGVIEVAEFPRAMLQWWAGDAAGAILLVPLLLTASAVKDRSTLGSVLGLDAAMALSAIVALILFPSSEATLTLAILPYGFLLWSALRYGAFGASSTAFTLSAVVVLCTAAGIGPFASGTVASALWSQWLFVAVTGTFSLVITALDNERAASERSKLGLERRFRNAFEDAPTAMAILDAEGRVQAANKTFRHLFGTADPLGWPLQRWADAAGKERLASALARPPDSSPGVSLPVVFTRETGAELHCVVRFTTMSRPGLPGARLAHIEDVTPARLAERERQRLTEQLVHSQRMDGIGQLAGGIAHDLNNILQAVTGNLELIAARAPDDPLQAQSIAGARHAASRATALTRQLLAFSRRVPMVPEVVDLGEVVRGATSMLSRLLPPATHLEVDVADGLLALADAPQLEQVLLNLVVNARDAMRTGGRILVVAWRVPETGLVELFVEDEGPGIPAEIRDRVFEPFFTTKEPGRGTGLGLAVAYGIVQAHGGRIWAEEGAHGGARVVVSLPPAPPARAEPVAVQATMPPAHPCTVLVADDDPDVLEVAEQLLRAEGYEVLTARDGVEAVERFRARATSIDVLVFDVVMPRLSGAEALRSLVDAHGPLPAVLVSGYTRDLADPAVLKDLGVEFLSKPYSRAQLVDAIARATTRGESAPRRARSA